MSKIIGVTEARARLKAILDEVVKKKQSFILMRGSRPEAVVIPYEEYMAGEERARKLWNERFDTALKRSQSVFREWLLKRGHDPDKLTEEEIERIIRSA